MAHINILDSYVYNRIAAGEVVERPFSVVKELVENSIDAGADNITVEIIDGGVTSIKVMDNGEGIEKSQLKSAVLPHATSKIKTVEDLDDILTLGFRGEALASIVSVAKVKISSKPANQEFGAEINAEGGVIGDTIDSAIKNGTEITVNNLFFNTPARQKFLKSFKGEENDVTNLLSRFILGNPEISFKYVSNGKVIYQSFGDGIESAMLSIYGTGVLNDCFFIDTEKNGIKVKGYIGKHHYTKPNRTYQSIFLNGRYIINSTISSAISNAYGAYLMKRQYPFYVLDITVPAETVDVNVHPNKTDVRFSNNQVIYGTLYSIISKVLDGSSEAVSIIKEKTEKSQIFTNENYNDYERSYSEIKPLKKEYFVLNDISVDQKNKAQTSFTQIESKIEENQKPCVDIFAENKKFIEELYSQKNNNAIQNKEIIDSFTELKFLAQALSTYLIFEDGKDLYFIDQHAAHERILFDEYIEKVNSSNISIQPLLVPYVFSVNVQENEFLNEKMPYFIELGFEIEQFGYNTFKISAIPTNIVDIDIKKFIDDVLSDMNLLRTENIPTILRERVASKACRAAIKSGDKLDDKDIKTLITLMKGNLGLKCPHGRPVAVKITRLEIDKWFKRIV